MKFIRFIGAITGVIAHRTTAFVRADDGAPFHIGGNMTLRKSPPLVPSGSDVPNRGTKTREKGRRRPLCTGGDSPVLASPLDSRLVRASVWLSRDGSIAGMTEGQR